MNNKYGFTLIEIAITAIIIGILILVGIPNMLKSTNRSYASDAMRNLMAIYAAEFNKKEENNDFFLSGTRKLIAKENTINTMLDLNLVRSGNIDYICNPVGGTVDKPTNVQCSATHSSFIMKMYTEFPITINASPVYCNGSNPTSSSSNPCCDSTFGGGGHVEGSLCP